MQNDDEENSDVKPTKTYYVLHNLGDGTGTLVIGFSPDNWKSFLEELGLADKFDKSIYSKLIALYYINDRLNHVSFSKLSPEEVEQKWKNDGRSIEDVGEQFNLDRPEDLEGE